MMTERIYATREVTDRESERERWIER